MNDDRAARALARASWPIRRVALAEEGRDEVVDLTAAERVAAVWRVTRDAWASSGRPMPTYRREEMPGKVVRRGGR